MSAQKMLRKRIPLHPSWSYIIFTRMDREKLTLLESAAPQDNWEIRSKDVLKKLNWLTLNQLRLTDTLLFMRKILKDEVPISISDQFQLSVNNQYNLRSNCTMLRNLQNLEQTHWNEVLATMLLKPGINCQLIWRV